MQDDFYDRMNRPWKETDFDLKYLWAAVVAITALATIIANAMIVIAVWRDPNKDLRRRPSNLLIASQSVADFAVGLIHDPLCCWWILTFTSTAVHVIEAVSSLFLVASVLHVTALSFDRYVAVVWPLRHNVIVTKRRVLIWSLIIWSYSAVYMAYRTVLRELDRSIVVINVISGVHTVLPSTISVLCYVRLHYALWKYRKRASNLDESGQVVMNAYRRERNMTKAMIVALALFLLCSSPWFLLYQIIGACPTCEDHKSAEMYLFAIFYYVFLFKSLINPFLYAWRLPKFRVVLKSMFKIGRIVQRHRVQGIDLTET